ncbi:MAG: Holliday junction resolvase RuvX [Planctomycetota bacterium]
MRWLAIDLGGKRTGLAIGSDETGLATPLRVIEHALDDTAEIERALAKAIEEQEPDGLVVGLPLNMDGSAGPPAKRVRHLAESWGARFSIPVEAFDERETSEMADEAMAQSGLTHKQKKKRRDAIAAAAILRGFLEHRRVNPDAFPA